MKLLPIQLLSPNYFPRTNIVHKVLFLFESNQEHISRCIKKCYLVSYTRAEKFICSEFYIFCTHIK